MSKKPYLLYDKNTQAMIYGYQIKSIQRMLDFDFICKREQPSVGCIINPTKGGFHKAFFGTKEILIPIYKTIQEALKKEKNIDTMINFSSFRSAFETTMQALETKEIKTVVVIAEGVPERKARILIAESKKRNKWIVGPSTVGGIVAGQFKVGNTGGMIENIISSKLHQKGSVGFVSKSGGMSNEMYNVISRNTNGIYEGVAIGGDAYSGSNFYDHVLRFEENPEIKMIVLLGEVGGKEENKIAKAYREGKIKKPLVAWVTGTCAKEFNSEVQFGHAGAKSGIEDETADAKNLDLKNSGIIVPNSFNDFNEKIKEEFEKLKKTGCIEEKEDIMPEKLPKDFTELKKHGEVRKETEIITTISCDKGEEATYFGEPISKIVEDDEKNIGYTLGLLWFKKKLPSFACKYIEMIIKTLADHGPCVSGAHNTIVTARAGKDLVTSLISGIATVGPRFGGAIDGAAYYFNDAFKRNIKPEDFVKEMKNKGINIPGIGHKIKSTKNPDKRVETLKEFSLKTFEKSELLKYSLEVEKLTTSKKHNLILNVDGCIAVTFLDMLRSIPDFSEEEITQAINLGYLNGLFILARSIGFMGHFFDQKRLDQGLYRYPMDNILYMTKGETN